MAFFAVEPKSDCPHVATLDGAEALRQVQQRVGDALDLGCATCSDSSENWICITCGEVHCARQVAGHMVQHNAHTGHLITTSFSDLSTWCYGCDSYIASPVLAASRRHLYRCKFGEDPPNVSIDVLDAEEHDKPGDAVGCDRTEYPDPIPLRNSSEIPDIVPEREADAVSHQRNDEIQEFEDPPDVLRAKASEFAKFLRECNYCVAYTGAGISTSASIPDYRGPKGVWTMRDRNLPAPKLRSGDIVNAEPTLCHRALSHLVRTNLLKFIVSTNVDGLHRRSGVPEENISELHGNIMTEMCYTCGRTYARAGAVHSDSIGGAGGVVVHQIEFLAKHGTGRKCTCGGPLHDTIVNFGENLPLEEAQSALRHSKQGDLALVLGTSMRVSPACDLPRPIYTDNGGKLVICNLQKTPYDEYCALRVWGRSDAFMKLVMEELGESVPPHDPGYWPTQVSEHGMDLAGSCSSLDGDSTPASRVDACMSNPTGLVEPSPSCVHVDGTMAGCTLDRAAADAALSTGCSQCDDVHETWVCMSCNAVLCGRAAKGHMLQHRADTGHHLAVSLADLSFWCYGCDSYVTSRSLASVFNMLHEAKFNEPAPPIHGRPL